MRVPIAYALHHPDRVDVPVKALDLAEVGALTFEPPDEDAFPCLRLAREAALAGGTAPCVMNAANEVAVHAFLNGRLGFLGIPAVIEGTLEQRRRRAACTRSSSLTTADAGRARGGRRADRTGARVSWILAFLGFAVADHPARGGPLRRRQGGRHARRALLAVLPAAGRAPQGGGDRVRRSGPIPLGGYVKITGMNPHEELAPELAHRAYYRQPVWKRIVVIGAGPLSTSCWRS